MSSKSAKEIIKEAYCWRAVKAYWRALGKDEKIGFIERIVELKTAEHEKGPE